MEDETVIFYADPLSNGQPDTNKPSFRLNEGEYINDFRNIGFNDWTSALYVHPRMRVDFWKGMNKTDTPGRAEGRNDGGPVKDLYWMKRYGFNDSISSAQATALMSKPDWIRACCRRETSDMVSQQLCGRYWNQGYSDCGNLGCTGDSLKTDTTCQNWCKNNPEYCDVLKSQFCREHTSDPYCRCINDTSEAIAERIKYSKYSGLGTVPRKCWPSSPCNTGTDLVNTYITSELSPNFGCPTSLVNQINEINAAQGATVIASQNQDAKIEGGGIDQSNVGYTPKDTTQIYGQSQEAETKKKFIWLFILLFFIIIIIIALLGWLIFSS